MKDCRVVYCLLALSIFSKGGAQPTQTVAEEFLMVESNQSISSGVPVRTSIDQTLEIASQKLLSGEESERVAAAKLLGKYSYAIQVCC